MTIFCLAKDKKDFEQRLNNILVAYSNIGKPVYVKDLKLEGSLDKPEVLIDTTNNKFVITTNVEIKNKLALDDYLDYIIPTGFTYETNVGFEIPNTQSHTQSSDIVTLLINPIVSISQVAGSSRSVETEDDTEFAFDSIIARDNSGSVGSVTMVGHNTNKSTNNYTPNRLGAYEDNIDKNTNNIYNEENNG